MRVICINLRKHHILCLVANYFIPASLLSGKGHQQRCGPPGLRVKRAPRASAPPPAENVSHGPALPLLPLTYLLPRTPIRAYYPLPLAVTTGSSQYLGKAGLGNSNHSPLLSSPNLTRLEA